jgi:hypothetical protein
MFLPSHIQRLAVWGLWGAAALYTIEEIGFGLALR